MNLFAKQTQNLENEVMVAEGRMGEGIVREFGMDMNTLLYLKWITKKSYYIIQRTMINVM